MKSRLLLSSVLVATSLFAASDADLLKAAKDAGLKALPTTQAQVDELLKEIGVKPNKFTKANENSAPIIPPPF